MSDLDRMGIDVGGLGTMRLGRLGSQCNGPYCGIGLKGPRDRVVGFVNGFFGV